MGYVVGNIGTNGTIAIILVAHVISITTGLSVSSISTDKKIKAGGIYYILSRSLGLPIGGAIGVTIFIGTALAIALYLVGFSESFIDVSGAMDGDVGWFGLARLNVIRLVATCALILIAIIAFISTSIALKTQFIILGFIVLSLIAIFFGSVDNLELNGAMKLPNKIQSSWFSMFAIFFPAVTGFTAGVAMSGDLKDPKKSIPNGTMWSIATGLVVYLVLAIFLANAIPPEYLRGDENVLKKFAKYGWMVVVGIWGATLSSAIGSLLGAPRILQAMALDKIGPRIFAKGVGPGNEPRNALLLTFAIAEAGILVGSLNTIAEVVSMFFLAAYGFINLAQFLESWASSDYLPSFKISKWFGLVGFLATLYIMMMLNVVAMVVALLFIGGIFVLITRKQLALGSGDVWQSVWSSVVRAGLKRMDKQDMHKRNWEPNVLLFSGGNENRPHLVQFSKALAGRAGMISNFDLIEAPESKVLFPKHKQTIKDAALLEQGIFARRQECSNIFKGIEMIASTYGFSGIEPNAVLMGWARNTKDPVWYSQMTSTLHDLDYNIMYLDYDQKRGFGKYSTIDIWWDSFSKDCEFMLSLVKLIQTSNEWRSAQVRVLMVNNQNEQRLAVEEQIEELTSELRIQASIKVVNNAIEQKSFYDLIKVQSFDTDLVFIPLPELSEENEGAFVQSTNDLVDTIGTTLMVRASSFFDELRIDLKKIDVFNQEEVSEMPFMIERSVALAKSDNPEIELHNIQLSSVFSKLNLKYAQDGYKGIQSVYRGKAKYLKDEISTRLNSFDGNKSELKKEMAVLFADMALDVSEQQLLPAAKIIASTTEHVVADYKATLESLPGKIKRVLSKEDLVSSPEDLPSIARSKTAKRRGAAIGIKPKVNIRYKALATDRFEFLFISNFRSVIEEFAAAGFTVIHQLNVLYSDLNEKIDELPSKPTKAKLGKLILEFNDQLDEYSMHLDQVPEQMLGRLNDLSTRYLNTLIKDTNRVDVNHQLEERQENQKRSILKNNLMSIGGFAERWLEFQQLMHNNLMLNYQLHGVQTSVKPVVEASIIRLRFGMFRNLKNNLNIFKTQLDQIQTANDFSSIENLSFIQTDMFSYEDIINDNINAFEEITATVPESIQVVDTQSFNASKKDALTINKSNIKLKELVEYMLESKLSQDIEADISKIQAEIQKVKLTTETSAKLVVYTHQNPEVNEEQVIQVLEKAKLELDNSIERVAALEDQLSSGIRGDLAHLSELLDAEALITRANKLDRYVKQDASKNSFSNKLRAVSDGFGKVYRKVAKSVWNKREELIQAQFQIENEENKNLHSVVKDFTDEISISSSVDEVLPFYYKQLFLGRHELLNKSVESRAFEQAEFSKAIQRHKDGSSGAILITGNAGSGYSQIGEELATRLEDGAFYQIKAPARSASISIQDFEQALFDSAEVQNWQEYKTKLNPGDTLLFKDIELWFAKGSANEAFENFMEFIRTYSGKLKFCLTSGIEFYKYARKVSSLDTALLSTIVLSPVSTEVTVKELIHRHRSGGMSLMLAGKKFDQMSKRQVSKTLRKYHSISNGNVGAASYLWLANITQVEGDVIHMSEPTIPNIPALNNSDWLVLLNEILVHKHLTIDLALTIFKGDSRIEIYQLLQSLCRSGLVTENHKTFAMNPYAAMFVQDILNENGII
jgi:amino acid transporter